MKRVRFTAQCKPSGVEIPAYDAGAGLFIHKRIVRLDERGNAVFSKYPPLWVISIACGLLLDGRGFWSLQDAKVACAQYAALDWSQITSDTALDQLEPYVALAKRVRYYNKEA